MTDHTGDPAMDVVVAGVRFRSPIGLAAIGGGSHFGKPDADPELEEDVQLQFLLGSIESGSSCVYINVSYLSEATLRKLAGGSVPDSRGGAPRIWADRFMRAVTTVPPYGVEGLYSSVSPGPSVPELEREGALLASQKRLVQALKEKRPEGVPIIGGLIGCGGAPDAYVDAARECEAMGLDLVEVNFHCPLQAGLRGGADNPQTKVFLPFSHGGLMTDHPDLVEAIVREVVRAVEVPVGVKFSAEVGFPRIVDMARRVKAAGAQYIHVGGAAVGIAPPDIYNRGRPSWPFMDGSPFCLVSGSWMRRVCYRDVAAVAKFVPGLDIVASGGLVTPEHCIEAMMLGATLTQMCTGVMEQGRGLLRRSNAFLQKFLADQGYGGARELVGLGLPYIKYSEDVDMMPGRVVVELDQDRCTRCGRCLNNLCVAICSEHGTVMVDQDKCTGCGACTLACRPEALRLVRRAS